MTTPAAVPLVVAQLLPPTVAQPPRMPFESVLDVTKPLVLALMALPGFVKSSVAPTFRVIAPTESSRGLVPLFVSVTTEAPALSVRPATVWLLVVLALPLRLNVPPPRTSDEAVARMLVAGAED